MTNTGLDPIELQVLRSRLQAVAEEGAITIERTAISPIISESRDYSCTLLEANGDLIVAGGAISHHFGICGHAVRATLATHGESVAPGDVFFCNDPHNGGGLHAQDVVVQLPVFVDGELVAWVANSGHMLDMGGMVFGSWSPDATDCYQEALRLPPVRLFRQGEEQTDVWQIIRTNVRTPDVVEMDLRGLVAGCEVARDKLVGIARLTGREHLLDGIGELRRRAEREMRRRITQLADGVYRYTGWTEWYDERYEIPCTMTVAGDTLHFDFSGAPGQTNHFFNTKPHIITAQIVGDGSDVLTHDIPLSQGMFNPVTVHCPANSIVNSNPPAPVASAHIDVSLTASMAAHQCIMLAVAAGSSDVARLLTGPVAPSAMAIQTWAYTTPQGYPDGWMMLDGAMAGTAAAYDRDGTDLCNFIVARKPILEAIDVEMLEAWYPVLVDFKRIRPGAFGAGRFRGGSGCNMQFGPYGVDAVVGQLLAVREHLPPNGSGGGRPGSVSEFVLRSGAGEERALPGKSGAVVVSAGESIEFRIGSAGGHGDPLDRDPDAVARDVRLTRLTEAEALAVYGVAIVDGAIDAERTARTRATLLRERLDAARPPSRPRSAPANEGDRERPAQTIYPGVDQRGGTAFARASGVVLAHAPDVWTDGCPVLEQPLGGAVVERSYLDPVTGRLLLVEAVPAGAACSVVSSPRRWTEAASV
ncbi:hydantoinase B/oxoprolinase family protein [Dactylosporangium sp. NPDC000244]|uniref:hydantoinase B/oxoprolinase family protein n=1 Tax=Dactylosporangium sp. NPDC000244 TaxID=3154365 RepID=UPI0033254E9D